MSRLSEFWLRLLASLWFLPAMVVVACVALALVLLETHVWVPMELGSTFPRLFGAGASGARGMLSAIATSMITVAGVVFSITIVALAQASSQYSPRVLRNFMNDRPTQIVLGMFVGIFAYCLIVLRTVRGGDEGGGFVPSVAVLGGVVLALVGVGLLIYYIHHVALAIQASSIISRIAHDTTGAIDRLFPEPVGRAHDEDENVRMPEHWHAVPARETGYIIAVDDDGLLDYAVEHGRVVRLAHSVGEFVIEGGPIALLSGDDPPDDEAQHDLCRLFSVHRQRTVHQDAPFGVQQLVDVAVKALSPGMNDPTTAVTCIDHLCALLVRLAGRHIPSPYRSDGNTLRVVAPGPDFEAMVTLAFSAITDHTRGDAEVFNRLLGAMDCLGCRTEDRRRREVLAHCLDHVTDCIARTVQSPARRDALLSQARTLALRMKLGRMVEQVQEPPRRAA